MALFGTHTRWWPFDLSQLNQTINLILVLLDDRGNRQYLIKSSQSKA